MFCRLLTTTALTVFTLASANTFAAETEMGKPVFSNEMQSEMTVDEKGYFAASETDILASDLLGKPLYNGPTEEAESVGDVNDVVVGVNGTAEAIIVGVGGFLGIGEKDIAIDFDRVSWMQRDGERHLIINATKEELEAAPAYERQRSAAHSDPAATDQQAEMKTEQDVSIGEDTGQTATMNEQTTADQNRAGGDSEQAAELNNDPTVEKDSQDEGTRMELASRSNDPASEPDAAARENAIKDLRADLLPAEKANLSADKLIGSTVHDAHDENIGEIGDVLLTDEKISGFVIDVGGFLGIGEKPVAVDINSIDIRTNDTGKLWVFTPFTKEQLEQQREYSESDYQNNPNDVVLR